MSKAWIFFALLCAITHSSCDHSYAINDRFVDAVDAATASVSFKSVSISSCAPLSSCLISVLVSNERNLSLSYTVTPDDTSLSGIPEVVSSARDGCSFAFTPDSSASGKILSFIVSIEVEGSARPVSSLPVSVSCQAVSPPVSFSLVYSLNGGTGTLPADSGTAQASGSIVTVASGSGFSRAGYLFYGWNTADDGSGTDYAVGDTITLIADVTLYALWVPSATITFAQNGGTGLAVTSLTVRSGDTATVSSGTGMSRSGQTLTGWNTAADGTGTLYASGSSLTASVNLTLYAQWANTSLLSLLASISSGGGNFVLSGTLTDAEMSQLQSAVAGATAPVGLDLSGVDTYSLPGDMFMDCVNLASVVLPDNLIFLPENCFYGCSYLASLTANANLQGFGVNCVAGCYALTAFTVPSNVSTFSEGCFKDSGLASDGGVLTFERSNVTWYYEGLDTSSTCYFGSTAMDIFGYIASSANTHTFTIRVPSSAESAYEALPLMSRYASKIVGY